MKNIKSKIIRLSLYLLFIGLLSACSNNSIDYNQIDSALKVTDIRMDMKKSEALKKLGSDYTKAPCVLGEEYRFDNLKLQVVFGLENENINRLTTKNDTSTLYGIKIGDKVSVVTKHILNDGFTKEADSNYKFINDNFRITVLSQDGISISGYMVDLLGNDH